MPTNKNRSHRSTPNKSEYRIGVAKPSRPVFSVRFTEGLATRNRLPLEHVIRVLNEIKGLMEDVGRRVQREHGDQNPSGDFGLELMAGFRRGSVQANIEITRNEEIGAIVAQQILQTVNRLGSKSSARVQLKGNTKGTHSEYDPRMVARLGNIGKVQEIDRTKTILSLKSGVIGSRAIRATLDNQAIRTVRALRAPNFTIEGLTIYGKLRELRDKYDDDDDGRKSFYGELLADDHTVWRVEFKAVDVHRVSSLFRGQVYVTGQATYYKARTPKLTATDFGADEQRDYEAAFDELFGSNREFVGTDIDALIDDIG